MFLTKKLAVTINPSNIKHFKKYFDNIEVKDEIVVNIDQLNKGSQFIINVQCDQCGLKKELKYKNYLGYGYINGDYLCRSCKLKKNNQEKYGVDNVFQLEETKEKSRKTCMKKYGVEYISQSNKTKDKIKQISIEKYGVNHFTQNDNIKNKQKQTNLEKYGVENPSQSIEIKKKKENNWLIKNDEEKESILKKRIKTNQIKYNSDHIFTNDFFKERIKQTNLEKYGVENPSLNKKVSQKIISSLKETLLSKQFENIDNLINVQGDIFLIKCDACGDEFKILNSLFYKRRESNTLICTNCNPVSKNVSGKEIQLLNFIKDNYNGTIIENSKKIISPLELDIYLPDLNLAFEFNGIYWHCELYKDNNYHSNKTKMCNNKNINLFHIFEDDWVYKQDIVKSMIINKINRTTNRIYARKTTLKIITNNTLIKEFLNSNHIQGYVGSFIKLGLFYNDDIVSLMTFKNVKDGYELNRFCNKLNTNVIGGASKLFKYFTKNYSFDKIISFSNNDYSEGNLYKTLNFRLDKKIKPDYSYIKNDKREHKFNFRKKKLSQNFNILNKTEHEICFENNIYRIYDSGKLKWVY